MNNRPLAGCRWALAVSCSLCQAARHFMQRQMLYLVAPLQLFAVGDIRNGRLTCLSALGSGERIDEVAIKCPERGYQEDARITHEAEAQPRPPCHNCSYLSAGGERILSMNNRLSLIFLGEARPPIGQLPEILILLIYGSIFLRERETRLLLNPWCPVKKCKMWSGLLNDRKMSARRKCHQKVEGELFWSAGLRCCSTLIMSNSSQTLRSLNKSVLFFWHLINICPN